MPLGTLAGTVGPMSPLVQLTDPNSIHLRFLGISLGERSRKEEDLPPQYFNRKEREEDG
jgi:hypothetical protein